MLAKCWQTSNEMQGGSFLIAGQRLADDDDRFASAPRGILFDANALKPLKSTKFDATSNGTPLPLWLEHMDKALHANPSVSQEWQGFSADTSPLAEQSLPRKLADLANVTITNLSQRSGSSANGR